MDIFTRFKQAVKIRPVLVDNEVFQLHYRVTAILLFASAVMVASKQHFGDPIDCITRDDVPHKIMDTYCWIHATFTLPAACNKTIGIEVPHPCVDKSFDKEERVYHKYYQWIYFVLFFQACCFYAPHFIWKIWESKLLATLTTDFKDPLSIKNQQKKQTIRNIVSYLSRDHTRHQYYFYHYTICEIMNFLNVILQMYLVDEFLGGTFTTYGIDVLNYIQLEQDERIDPMVRVFPRMTKCTFHRFGASGDVQKHDALCILPLNIINEKIYVFMWFWFVFLAIVSGAWLIYRLMTYLNPDLRYEIIRRRATHANTDLLRYVLKSMKTGDWFLLSMISKNMDTQWYRVLIKELKLSLEKKKKKKEQDEKRSKERDGSPVIDPEEVVMIDHSADEQDSANDSDSNSAASMKTDIESGHSMNSGRRIK